jgi:endonuclease G
VTILDRIPILVLVASLVFPLGSVAAPLDQCLEFVVYGLPSTNGDLLCRKGFALAHNPERKTADWVAEHLTRERTHGPVDRLKNFRGDPELKSGTRAVDSDYTNSGYARGHMAPAANMQWDPLAMYHSFFLSNVAPQNGPMNSGAWSQLEELVRDWAVDRGALYVFTGPIYGANPKTIGKSKVAVPSHVYKIVFDPVRVDAIAFLFPNEPTGAKTLPDFLTSVDDVEARTGLDFLSAIASDVQAVIESKTASALWE